MINDKPFIQIFTTFNKYFLYDVNKNDCFEITNEEKIIIDELKEIGLKNFYNKYLHSDGIYKKMIDLISFGYFQPNYIEKIEHPLTNYCEDYLDGHCRGLILQVTQNCNLRCRYCSYSGDGNLDRKHNNKNMDFLVAKNAIDFFKIKSRKSDEVHIAFYGGEPLLNFDLIEKCINYIKINFYDKIVKFNITTNGTIMTKHILDVLASHDVKLTISLDGPEEIHNKKRRFATDGHGSFSKVITNLEFIKSENIDYFNKLNFNAVIEMDDTFDKINLVKEFFESSDIFTDKHNIIYSLVSDRRINRTYYQSNDFAIYRKATYFKNLIEYFNHREIGFNFGDVEDLINYKEILEYKSPLKKCAHHGGPCMPGRTRLIVDINGKLRPCEKVSEISTNFVIGTIDEGFDINQVKKLLNIGQITEEECKKCWAIRLCKICAEKADAVSELSPELKLERCSIIKSVTREKLIDIAYLKKMKVL